MHSIDMCLKTFMANGNVSISPIYIVSDRMFCKCINCELLIVQYSYFGNRYYKIKCRFCGDCIKSHSGIQYCMFLLMFKVL